MDWTALLRSKDEVAQTVVGWFLKNIPVRPELSSIGSIGFIDSIVQPIILFSYESMPWDWYEVAAGCN